MLNKKDLHRAEMDLVYWLDEGVLTRDKIIDCFTGLLQEVE